MLNNITYAPVIIPTLNRYDHFRNCLESLEKCTGADNTEVYVGLDYPPSEKYVEGWRRINDYLLEKEKNNGFKSLFVRRREHNCGVGHAYSNSMLLRYEIYDKYDRYIFTEDDNVFSPCFLEFINNCFEKYKNDKQITVVCGYTHPEFCYKGKPNIQCVIDTPAYGMGCWKWYDEYINERTYNWFFSELKKSKRRTLSLFRRYPAVIYMSVSMIWKKFNSGDLRQSILNMINGTYAICPSVSLSRNMGADGSGLHSGYVEGLDKQEILIQKHFLLDEINIKTTKKHDKLLFKLNMPKNWLVRQAVLIQRLSVVLIFLFFDKRSNADEPFSGFINFIIKTWERGKRLKWTAYKALHK